MQCKVIDSAFIGEGVFALKSLFAPQKAQWYPGRLVGAGASLPPAPPPAMGAGVLLSVLKACNRGETPRRLRTSEGSKPCTPSSPFPRAFKGESPASCGGYMSQTPCKARFTPAARWPAISRRSRIARQAIAACCTHRANNLQARPGRGAGAVQCPAWG